MVGGWPVARLFSCDAPAVMSRRHFSALQIRQQMLQILARQRCWAASGAGLDLLWIDDPSARDGRGVLGNVPAAMRRATRGESGPDQTSHRRSCRGWCGTARTAHARRRRVRAAARRWTARRGLDHPCPATLVTVVRFGRRRTRPCAHAACRRTPRTARDTVPACRPAARSRWCSPESDRACPADSGPRSCE